MGETDSLVATLEAEVPGFKGLEARKRYNPQLSFSFSDVDSDCCGPGIRVDLDDFAVAVLERMYPEAFEDGYEHYKESTTWQKSFIKEQRRTVHTVPKAVEGTVYFVKATGQDLFKIGITGGDVGSRVRGIQTSCPFQIELYAYHKMIGCEQKEVELHERFKRYRTRGEWFKLAPAKIDAVMFDLI